MTAGQASTSFTIYDLLTRVIPGMVFLTPQVAIFTQFKFGFMSDNPTYWGLVVIIGSLLIGELINGLRLSMLDVPNQFRRVLYSVTENEDYLRRGNRMMIRIGKWFSQSIREIDYGFATHSLFDYHEQTIVDIVNQRFEPSDDIKNAYDIYEIIISDLSGNESRRTRRLRSVYIFQKNTRLALMSSAILALLISLSGFVNPSEFSNAQVIIALFVALLLFLILYFVFLFAQGVASLDRIYIESLLSDYFTHVTNT